MARIYMKSSNDVDAVITHLNTLRSNFNRTVLSISIEHMNLTAKYEGDASTEFNKRFSEEKGNFDLIDEAIKNYIDALYKIKTSIEVAEERNKAIAAGK